jgi:hypothetical protein
MFLLVIVPGMVQRAILVMGAKAFSDSWTSGDSY